MIKLMQLITKRDGLSRDDFVRYYEDVHVPLLLSLLPSPCFYQRNYPVWTDTLLGDRRESFAAKSPFEAMAHFDVISEVGYETREKLDEAFAAYLEPATQKRIAQDEANFVAPHGVKRYLVELYRSEMSGS